MNPRRLSDDELVFAIFRKVAAAPRKLASSFNAVLSYHASDLWYPTGFEPLPLIAMWKEESGR